MRASICCGDDKNDILITPSQLCDPSQGCSLSRKPAGWHHCWIVSAQHPTVQHIHLQQATDMGPGIRLETKESSNINKETDNNPIRPGYMCV